MSDKRTRLESVAAKAVQHSGFNNLSFRKLADEVGVKSSSVHYYFPEKSDLAVTLINNYREDFAEQLQNIENRKISPRRKLQAFVDIFEQALSQNKFCLCGMMAAEAESLDAESKQALDRYFQYIEDWLTLVIEEEDIIEGGSQPSTKRIKPRALARMILSGLEGAILIDRIKSRKDFLRSQKELISLFVD